MLPRFLVLLLAAAQLGSVPEPGSTAVPVPAHDPLIDATHRTIERLTQRFGGTEAFGTPVNRGVYTVEARPPADLAVLAGKEAALAELVTWAGSSSPIRVRPARLDYSEWPLAGQWLQDAGRWVGLSAWSNALGGRPQDAAHDLVTLRRFTDKLAEGKGVETGVVALALRWSLLAHTAALADEGLLPARVLKRLARDLAATTHDSDKATRESLAGSCQAVADRSPRNQATVAEWCNTIVTVLLGDEPAETTVILPDLPMEDAGELSDAMDGLMHFTRLLKEKEDLRPLLEVLLALHRHRLATGSVPQQLESLVPRYLKRLPAPRSGTWQWDPDNARIRSENMIRRSSNITHRTWLQLDGLSWSLEGEQFKRGEYVHPSK